VAGRPLDLLLVALGVERADRMIERAAGRPHAVELGVRPAQIAERLGVRGVLLGALLQLLNGLVHLAHVIVGVALLLVAQSAHNVLNATGTVRIAGLGGTSEDQTRRREHRGADSKPSLVHCFPPWERQAEPLRTSG